MTEKPGSDARCVIVDSSRSFVTEIKGEVQGVLPRPGGGVVRLQLKPEERVRARPDGPPEFFNPRDAVARTLDEALELGWVQVVEAKPRKPDPLLAAEQAAAVDRVFQRRMRPDPRASRLPVRDTRRKTALGA